MPAAAWLILPTFDEAENIAAIVAAARAVLERAVPGDHRILVVDDGSPDGTGDDRRPPRRRARRRRGPAPHGPRGPRPGLPRRLRPRAGRRRRFVMEMDSDFSHDPADLERLLAAIADADLVLGSRYVPAAA